MNTLLLYRKVIANKPNLVVANRNCNSISKCTFCTHYKMQTGSVGQCQLLNAPVLGAWKSCSLGKPVFTPNWE
ncbi:hypothetical protein CP500_008965 [Tychonema bourrellyi FEM_GT703]|uniref:Uncharacterized protein n=1 Tax=Tychonema bourrellyi FEM_GT703 TaxID=2040638 RepID=A0A2G4F239_9CYAN|nr:hypothetical protein CP500_008965 [Tychonema bourrellyi FEM_GT703]